MVNANLSLSALISTGIIGTSNIYSIQDNTASGFCFDLFGGFSLTSGVDLNPIILFPCHLDDLGQNQQVMSFDEIL